MKGALARWVTDPQLFTFSVMALALLPRLYVAIAWGREPVWDGHYYHFGATRIAAGLGYSEDVLINGVLTWKPWSHYPVGYSGFLGALYKVFGTSLLVAPIANAVVGALTVGAVHRLATCYLSNFRAAVAALICALHPGLILYTALVMTEPLTAFGLALAGLLAFKLPDRRGAAAAGLALGLSALVRPTALLAIPLMLLVFWPRSNSTPTSQRISHRLVRRLIPWLLSPLWTRSRRPLALTALTGLTALAAIAPWTARNCRTMDGCALISTNGGWNLAIGALTETGRFVTLTPEDGCREVTGQVQQDRCWAKVGRQAIRQEPAAWLSLMPQKLAHTYNHESFAVGYLAEANPDDWSEERKQQTRNALTLFHHLLMLAAVFSLIGRPALLGRPASPSRSTSQDLARSSTPGSANADSENADSEAPNSSSASLHEGADAKAPIPPPRDGWISGDHALATATQLVSGAALMAFVAYALNQPERPLFWLIVFAPLLAAARLPGAPTVAGVPGWAWAMVLATTITHAVFFGDDRYHLTVSPLLCVLAAGVLRRGRRVNEAVQSEPNLKPADAPAA